MAIASIKIFDINDYQKDNFTPFERLSKNFKFLHLDQRLEDFGIDVAVYLNKTACLKNIKPVSFIELEVKHNWKGEIFPYNEVHFLAKKQKHFKQKAPAYWVLFNDDHTECGIVPFSKILTCNMIKKYCRNIGEDIVYSIPKKDFTWGIKKVETYLIGKAFESYSNIYNSLF